MLIYRLLLIIFSPILLGHIIWKAVSNKQSRYFWQRLGFNLTKTPDNCTWFHCASVGEVNTLLPLLKNLHKKNSRLNFIITTNTVTGAAIIDQQKLDYLFHNYLPFDWPSCVKRFLNRLDPATLYVMETEIWPNLFKLCRQNNITLNIINARLSSKTTSTKPWIKSLLKTCMSGVNAIYARSDNDAHAYELLGADKKIISTAGNLKLTTALSAKPDAAPVATSRNISIDREFVLLASTHDDEESNIYTLWKKLNRSELLIIAPRHPERGSAIAKMITNNGLAIRSKNQEVTSETNVFLLDTVGELKHYFPLAKLVIMGGSFVPVGGHNILEPASYNAATVTGPHMENFKDELKLMHDKNAIIQVDSYTALEKELVKLLDNESYRSTLKKNTGDLTHNAEEVLEKYTGIILKH